MRKKLILYLFLGITTIVLGQKFPEKNKKYDEIIFEFLLNLTEKDSISIETFLVNTKPFSKWDIRPLKRDKIWAFDTIINSSELPNFIWGAFAKNYKLSTVDALKIPNQFLKKGVDESNSLGNYLILNLKQFNELSKLIIDSKNEIYLNQGNLQRINNLYKEDGQYWKYIIPFNSPFPISNKIKKNIQECFSVNQIKILGLLKYLKIYSAIKTKKGIFYLIDGFTDNSFGFYFNSQGQMEKDNFLFKIMKNEKINNNYYYYVAN